MAERFTPDRPGAHRPQPVSPPKNKGGIVALLAVGCVLILILANMLRAPVPGAVLAEPPAEAVGNWVASDPRYVDRGLRVGARELVLGVGPDEPPVRGRILVVSSWQEDQADVVRIEYDAGDGPMVLEMILEGGDRMRLRNPPDVVWNRIH